LSKGRYPQSCIFLGLSPSSPCLQGLAILHAYGGAKVHAGLQLLKEDRWLPLAAAMVGTERKPPTWATEDFRPVTGTSLDIRIRPTVLSVLSRWHRHCDFIRGSALDTWLKNVKKEFGPDSDASPHKPVFFWSDCCMAQRLRCPGGRPSVSYEKLK